MTIGAFDGVHIGHRALIDQVKKSAAERNCASVVVTFDRHPASVVRPQSAPHLLTDLNQKLELLAGTGVDHTLVLPFDEARAAEAAEKFVREVLFERLSVRAIVVGYDFHFGRERQGNVELLQKMGAEYGFDVLEADLVEDGEPVSSTRIRALLTDGDVTGASVLLGRPHEVRGIVIMGDGRGRDLGYPTANVNVPPDILAPGDGVYAGHYVLPDGTVCQAAVSVGTRPTFYDQGARIVEAWLVDYQGDLYGQIGRIGFAQRLRAQEKFDSVEALVSQLHADAQMVRASHSESS